MRPRDFALLVLVCVFWAMSNVLSKIVVAHWMVPPLFYAAVRFALVALLTLPWLLPIPRPVWRIVAVGLLMGGGNFALMFVGLQTSSPSAAAVVVQASVPITTLLSVVLLKERIHWRRGIGILLALSGVLVVVWQPGLRLSGGLTFVLGAALAGSFGAIMMKQMEQVSALRFQAWVGLTSFAALAPASALLESHQMATASAAGWPFVGAVVFSALIVSVFAHTAYYGLIARYEANLIAPLTLMTPVATITLGVLFTGDHLDARLLLGTGVALAGVLLVAIRRTGAPIVETQEHA
ncbi:DMT family transporter [Novosphingobium sp. FKTRR1]|uniref:DMT family transporter n=1 Tax=Novosphingobium sp. FKTRR1 TaxID=2879118 RepID=UPI001CEFE8F7|nr:DMT family transporter [Novosphingobium sp. FKTRR1]